MSRPWLVFKFGGTSVAGAGRWERIADCVRERIRSHRIWIVASAVAGVSDALEAAVDEALAGEPAVHFESIREIHCRLADELGLGDDERREAGAIEDELASLLDGVRLTREAPPRLVARILSCGELVATRLGIAALARHGIQARWVDARRILQSRPRTRQSDHQRYLEADVPLDSPPVSLGEEIEDAGVVLTQGFIARTPRGETCLLGRGGSDTSGALFAALLGAAEFLIWSDVPGMFTADPRHVPRARLIRRVGYREAQELAAMGAKVLHPRCLGPVAAKGIPVTLHSIEDPTVEGTRIEATGENHPAVTAVTCRSDVTLLTLSTLAMWEAPGFLARVFAPFEELGISVDLVATSQSAVSVTLDMVPGGLGGPAFAQLVERLQAMGKLEVVHPCGVVSVVGRRIRAALHELGPAMEVFQDRPVRLVIDSSEDLNLSFVVDEEQTRVLVTQLHDRLFPAQGVDDRLGATWEVLEHGRGKSAGGGSWWRDRAGDLLSLVPQGEARYVYHLPTVIAQARRLRETLTSVDRIYYSMKANAHARILEAVAGEGLGIECVSAAEVARVRELLGADVPVLFTPNFCPLSEYAAALEAGAEVTVDGPEPLERSPEVFRGSPIAARIDPGRGLGHHSKVRTAGARAKFGLPRDDFDDLVTAARQVGSKIVGLHAHVGSGILDPVAWSETGRVLAGLIERCPELEWIDLGGGLGVPGGADHGGLALDEVERSLAELRRDLRDVRLRIEPGRFLVSEAGVLLASVTQVRRKGDVRFVGLATGMNSFIRPALYGAWHGIHNLTRLDEPTAGYWNVVGPICETSDVLGSDRLLPETFPNDVMLIENAGAYGAVMASSYNLRSPAPEVVLEC